MHDDPCGKVVAGGVMVTASIVAAAGFLSALVAVPSYFLDPEHWQKNAKTTFTGGLVTPLIGLAVLAYFANIINDQFSKKPERRNSCLHKSTVAFSVTATIGWAIFGTPWMGEKMLHNDADVAEMLKCEVISIGIIVTVGTVALAAMTGYIKAEEYYSNNKSILYRPAIKIPLPPINTQEEHVQVSLA